MMGNSMGQKMGGKREMLMVDMVDIVEGPATMNELVAGLATELTLWATALGVKWVLLLEHDV